MNIYPFAFDEVFDIDMTGKFVVTGLFTLMKRSDVVHYIYTWWFCIKCPNTCY